MLIILSLEGTNIVRPIGLIQFYTMKSQAFQNLPAGNAYMLHNDPISPVTIVFLCGEHF